MNELEIREKLQKEFDGVFNDSYPHQLLSDVGTVVFLSAPQDTSRDSSDPAHEMSAENVSRAMYAVLLASLYGSRRPIRLVLSGETEQLSPMKRLVRGFGFESPHFSAQQLDVVNSGNRGNSHTGTQFTTLVGHFRALGGTLGTRPVVFVTNQYHVPRAQRYAAWHFGNDSGLCVRAVVVGVPNDTCLYDRATKVADEIEKIIRYAEQGIFDLFPSV